MTRPTSSPVSSSPVSRRSFLAASGSLIITLSATAGRPALAQAAPEPGTLTAFLEIAPTGRVKLWSPTSEMGQGIHTGHAMVIAEELGVPLANVSVETANPAPAFRRGSGPNASMSSGGSWGMRAWAVPLRKAAAQARTALLAEAAAQRGIPAAELDILQGNVVHNGAPIGSIGTFAKGASAREFPAEPSLRPTRRLAGTRQPRLDLPAKVRGEPVYCSDIALPGMVHACARLSPVFRGELDSFDEATARSVKGVQQVVALPGGAAVVATSTWAAMKGAEALQIRFKPTPHDKLDSATISAHMAEALNASTAAPAKSEGDFAAAWGSAATRVEADYEVPYLAHTPLEPWSAVVRFNADGTLDVWAPTQAQDRLLRTITATSELPAGKVTIHTTQLGGGFGRRLRDEEGIRDAVLVAKAVGKPVRFFWRREDEIGQGWYRPAQAARLKAALDPSGKVTGLSIRTAGPSMVMDFAAPATPIKEGGLDGSSVQSLADTRYRPAAYALEYAMRREPVPTAPWRAVGSTQNGYFLECFLDEVAKAAGKDPLALRRDLLAHDARALKVLDTVARESGWGTPLPNGHARGIAYVESYGSLCAEVAQISLVDGMPRVHRVTVALDCGSIVSRDGVISQVEGGVVQGISSCLWEGVDIAGGAAATRNLDSYQLLRMKDAPARIDVHIIESGEPMGGVGEPPLPPAGPAVLNALFALTGKPVRKLPALKTLGLI
jgi:isoquinoline 1-oxidoreductase beta subunit